MLKLTNKQRISASLILRIITLTLGVLFLGSCSVIPSDFPATSITKFNVSAPDKFDCYQQHSHQTKVTMLIDIMTYYYDGTKKVTIDDKHKVIDPNVTPFPVEIDVLEPSDGTALGYYEVNMVGQECTECANDWEDQSEAGGYGSCPSGMSDPNLPDAYIAAKPRWRGSNIFQHYQATADVGAFRISNVPNSCGCPVY